MEGKFFEVTVEGQYAYGEQKNTQLADYTEKFKLPFSGGEALSAIRKKMIPTRLKKSKPHFKFVRTCQIVEVKETKGALLDAKSIPKMDMEQLIQFTAENKMILIPSKYGVEDARRLAQEELNRNALAAKKKTKNAKPKAPAKQDMMGDRGMEFDEIIE